MRTRNVTFKLEQKNRLVARRTVVGTRDGNKARITITLLLPATSRAYSCELRYTGSFNNKKIVKGKDLLDSLQNALIYIAADLFAFTRATGIPLTWKHVSGGSYATKAGFPSFPGLQIMDLGPDRRIDSSS